MEHLLIGFSVFFNLAIIMVKLNIARYEDATFDIFFLALIGYTFSGSYDGLVAGTIASAFMSVWLLIFPPKFVQRISKFVRELA